ncbi:hypothetical protein Btru_069947 [Bulinus truncatus]|nr:hypothetical protein Btru_069947 [Bulinus truncatus]
MDYKKESSYQRQCRRVFLLRDLIGYNISRTFNDARCMPRWWTPTPSTTVSVAIHHRLLCQYHPGGHRYLRHLRARYRARRRLWQEHCAKMVKVVLLCLAWTRRASVYLGRECTSLQHARLPVDEVEFSSSTSNTGSSVDFGCGSRHSLRIKEHRELDRPWGIWASVRGQRLFDDIRQRPTESSREKN